MPSQEQKPRLWILPWGLYPRRVTIYLEEKGLTDHFDIIPVQITLAGQEEVEGKPPGTMPILELERPTENKPGRYVFQSSAILEYLEDIYGSQGPDMRGTTPEARARVRECMDMMNEVTTWMALYMTNGSSLYAMLRKQRREAAEEGLERMHKALGILEKLADPEGPFLVGESPTIVDCTLMATNQFAEAIYHFDLLAKHPRLKKVVDAFSARGTAVFPELPESFQKMDIKMHVT